MSRYLCLLSAVVVGAIIVCQVQAQPPQGRRGMRGPGQGMSANPARLLMNPAVQKEIKVNDEQMQKIRELAQSMRPQGRPGQGQGQRPSFRDMTEEQRQEAREQMQERRQEMQARMQDMQKKLGEILDSGQMNRLQQINLQTMGPGLFRNPRVAEALKITDEQRTEMREAMQGLRPQRGGEGQGPNGPPAAELREKMMAKMTEVLTEEQNKTLKGMLGEPFDVAQLQQRRGGPNRPRGQGRQGGGARRPGGGQRGQQ